MTASPAGLLLSRDLIFTSKIVGTARGLGHRMLVAGAPDLAAEMIERERPKAIFVDLTAGDLVAVPALVCYRRLAGPGAAFLAFGPHVDAAALAGATAAGCEVVLPRSKFAATLADLIQRFLQSDPPGAPE